MMVLTGKLASPPTFCHDAHKPEIFTLSGVNKLEDFEAADAPIKPDYYMNSLGDLKAVIE